LKSDPEGLRQVFVSADDPRPEGTTAYGSADLRRLHVDRYRLLYEVLETQVRFAVLHVGRTA
jgi:mRNA interferase RelE/StbE